MKTIIRNHYEISYQYIGFDGRLHRDTSIVRGGDKKDAVKTLGAIINRKSIQGEIPDIHAEHDLTQLFWVEKIALSLK